MRKSRIKVYYVCMSVVGPWDSAATESGWIEIGAIMHIAQINPAKKRTTSTAPTTALGQFLLFMLLIFQLKGKEQIIAHYIYNTIVIKINYPIIKQSKMISRGTLLFLVNLNN